MLYRNPIWIYPNYLNEEECNIIEGCASRIDWIDGMIGQKNADPDAPKEDQETGNKNSKIRQSDLKWMNHEVMPFEITQKIEIGIQSANQEAGWNLIWDYIEPHQYTRYIHRPTEHTPGDHYTWHVDQHVMPTSEGKYRKLSSTIQLSDPDDYEGGHFEYIEFNSVFDKLGTYNTLIDVGPFKKSIPFSAKAKGTLIVFPSDTYHQVTPVTRGERRSLVSWFHGPKAV